MNDWLHQTWQEIAARPEGPLAMRFYLQPSMSTFFAIRDGLKDARKGRPPYFWSVFTDPTHRTDLVQDGWRSIGKIFILAAALDILYQLIVMHELRPLQTILIATLLAVVPYLIVRGPINRIAMWLRQR
jgi:hypothetical protein